MFNTYCKVKSLCSLVKEVASENHNCGDYGQSFKPSYFQLATGKKTIFRAKLKCWISKRKIKDVKFGRNRERSWIVEQHGKQEYGWKQWMLPKVRHKCRKS